LSKLLYWERSSLLASRPLQVPQFRKIWNVRRVRTIK
jgi:hypothetical protein